MSSGLREYEYESSLADCISALVAEKRALGYVYNNEAMILKWLDSYWLEHGYPDRLEFDSLSGWISKTDAEGNKSLSNRIVAVRQLAMYMRSVGKEAVVPENNVTVEKPMVHVLSSAEIRETFERLDGLGTHNDPASRVAYDSSRVALRLILGIGSRAGETCALRTESLDQGNMSIDILDAKNDRQRTVYLTEDLCGMLANHRDHVTGLMGSESEWLFPGFAPGMPINVHMLERWFNKAWARTSFAGKVAKKPTVHSLRHTYVNLRIRLWEEEGTDVNEMLPYLTRHLGHETLDETYYYYQKILESLRQVRAKDGVGGRVIPSEYGI